jgi:threonyl-tRNA synthetase
MSSLTPEHALFRSRHSLSHILAQAVQRIYWSSVQLGIWPAIDTGFYYDMIFSKDQITDESLKEITKIMTKITKEPQEFICYSTDTAEAMDINTILLGQSYKVNLLQWFIDEGQTTITYYLNTIPIVAKDKLLAGADPDYIAYYDRINDYFHSKISKVDGKYIVFCDMCEWPHVWETKEIPTDCFVLQKIAGAYWRWDEKNAMMTRIYGLAFEDKKTLKEYLNFLEEAKKRDHRVIGKQLKLFTISDLVGSGLPLFQPNGMIIRKEIEDYLRELHKLHGYSRVWTPHIAKEDLYNTSGHAKHYLDDMFKVHGGTSNEDFYLKPMNCPHHMQLFADNQFSYRDMPIRYFEPATVYRDEKTWQLAWLTRVRSITQDDGHLFCRITQLKNEITTIVHIIKQFYTTMGMLEWYRVSLSLRGEDKEKYLGTEIVRKTAEWALKEICIWLDLNYKQVPGEAAFYGPKLDFMFKDAIGRQHQLATVQIDFNLPERFDLSFVNEKWEEERPVVVHRAIAGSLERCMGVMIEHFCGAFPLWLTPEQIRVVPVAEVFVEYASQIQKICNDSGLRTKVDTSDDSFSKKIRNAETDKVYYVLIVWEKEVAENSVSIRNVRNKEQEVLWIKDFIAKAVDLYNTRGLIQ